jgi:RHS repeat-associated protein
MCALTAVASGQYTDTETGLQYLRARYYDPTTGTFPTVDPAYDLTLSRYGDTADNPLNATDPSGLVVGVDDAVEDLAGRRSLDVVEKV